MKKTNGLLLLALGAAGGYFAAKYGKQTVNTVKGVVSQDSLNEIKNTVKKGTSDIKKSIDNIKHDIDLLFFDEGFLSMAKDYEVKETDTVKVEDEEIEKFFEENANIVPKDVPIDEIDTFFEKEEKEVKYENCCCN